MTLLLVDTSVIGYEQITAAAKPDVNVILFDRYIDTFEELKAKIAASGAAVPTTIGIVQHGNQYAPTYTLLETQATPALISGAETEDPSLESWSELKDFYSWLAQRGATTIDLISCGFYANPDWVFVLQTLENQLSLNFRASINNTGNIASGGDWIQESDGVDIQDIYFTEAIVDFVGLLYTVYYRQSSQIVRAPGATLNGQLIKGSITTNANITATSLPENMIVGSTTQNTAYAWGLLTHGGSNAQAALASSGSPVVAIESNQQAFAALRSDGSVYSWGEPLYGGSAGQSALANSGSPVVAIAATTFAFAALRSNGSVFAWGAANNGGDNTQAAPANSGSTAIGIASTTGAFAALRSDGTVYAWGDISIGGSNAQAALASSGSPAVALASTQSAFAALRSNGSVAAWGSLTAGGSNALAAAANTGSAVLSLAASQSAFAALKADGSVYAWGDINSGGSNTQAALANSGSIVIAIASTDTAFAGLKANGTVYSWGNLANGGSNALAAIASSGSPVVALASNQTAFAALRSDGTVYAWGNATNGGSAARAAVASSGSPVVALASTQLAFAALRSDGTVFAWGESFNGGNNTQAATASSGSPVVSLGSTLSSFVAIRADGTLYAWGDSRYGGSNTQATEAGSGNLTIASAGFAFAALKPTSIPANASSAVSAGSVGNFVATSTSTNTSLSLSLRSAINAASGTTRATARSDFIKSMADRLQSSRLIIPSSDFATFKATILSNADSFTTAKPVLQYFPTINALGTSSTLEISSVTSDGSNYICFELPINIPTTLTENGLTVGTIFYDGTNLYNGTSASAPQIAVGTSVTFGTKIISGIAIGSLVGNSSSLTVPLITTLTPWLWLDADDSTTITTTGATSTTLTGWKNKGSTGTSSFGTLSGAGTGTYNTVTANGRPLVSLNNRIFSTNAIIQTEQSYSIFAVYSIKSNYDASGIDIIRPSDNASVGLLAGEFSASTTSYGMRAANAGQGNRLLGTSFNSNSVGVKLGVFYNSTNTANSIITNNGAPLTLTTNIAASGANTTTAYTYNINPTANAVVDYGEMLVYMGEITTAQRQSIEGYLAWKWGLQDSLPLNHPNNPYYNKTQLLPLPVPFNNDLLPRVWYDAADLTTINANQNTLTAWQNKGTLGSTAGGTLSGTITTGTTTINGRNTISLESGATFTTASLAMDAQPFAVFFVSRIRRTFTNPTTHAIFSPSEPSRIPQILLNFDETYGYSVQGNRPSANRVIAGSLSNFTNTTQMYSVVNSAIAANNRITINGTEQTLSVSIAAGGPTLSAVTYYIDGLQDVGEIIVFTGEITQTFRYHIEGYLAWKWGLQTSLPATHPYHPTFKDSTLGLYVRPRLFVSTYAGLSGTSGSTDNVARLSARFNEPEGICVDSSGNLYVSEISGQRIRRIPPTGNVTTLAGSYGLSGTTDATGSNARFNLPSGLALNPAGTLLYVADFGNRRIRQIVIATGVVTTLAGPTGTALDFGYADGTGATARFRSPIRLAVHPTTGDIYVADADNHNIRKITPAGVVTTPYGPPADTISVTSGATDGVGNNARFNIPEGLVLDSTNNILFVSEAGNRKIRKIDLTTNMVSTYIGVANTSSSSGHTDGFGTDVTFVSPRGICRDAQNILYMIDGANGNNVREISPGGGVVTIAGPAPTITTPGTADGMDVVARFNFPTDIVIYNNDFYVVDRTNHSIRLMTAGSTNQVGTYLTGLTNALGVAVDGFGNVYNSSQNRVTRTNIYGTLATFAGDAATASFLDGAGTIARFSGPSHMGFDYNYNLFVNDQNNNRVRRISLSGLVTTYAGTGAASSLDGPGSSATFNSQRGLCIDKVGNLYVSEFNGFKIRKITQTRNVTTYAGTGASGTSDGSGNRYTATFTLPEGITIDSEGSLFIIDRTANNVRKITQSGVFSNFAGSGTAAVTDGTGTGASFSAPEGIAIDLNDNLYSSEIGGDVIRRITPSAVVTTLAGLANNFGTADGIGSVARFRDPHQLVVDGAGNLFVCDFLNFTVRCMRFYNPGRPVVGSSQTLTLNGTTTAITDRNTGVAFSYQWLKSDSLVNTYANITSATNVNYIPVASDVNAGVRLYATYTNTVGSTVTVRSDPIIPMNVVLPGIPVPSPKRPFAWQEFIRFNWNFTDTLFTSSVVVACNGPNASTRILPALAGQTTYTGLTNGATYTTTINAISGGGISSFIAAYNDTQPGFLPTVPLNPSFSIVEGNRVRVTWETPTGDGGSPIGWYALTSANNAYRFGIEPFRREFISPSIPNGTYTFILRAVNAVGYGDPALTVLTI
jgi:sugar lactone lactonase YvrE/alpha-tubulin suppressor-like RCC1 family protein